jgi:tetratricopeptide (TPR) repeat protein
VRFALLLSLLFFSTGVRAAETATPAGDAAMSESRRADAKARYEQGAAAYAAGRFKDAVDLFLEADALAPSAPLSFNIARAYEKLGDDSGALRWYRDYLRRAPDAANAKDVQAAVDGLENRLAKKGVQQLTVLSTPAGATVTVDGRPVGVTPWTGDLLPGKHSVGLSLRGYDDQTLEVELAGHRSRDLTATLVQSAAPVVPAATAGTPAAVPVTPAPNAPAREAASGGLGIWPWVTLGAGGAALGGALVFELLRRGSEGDAEADDTQIGYQEKLDQMESHQTTARILAGVGGALVVTGGVLLAIDLGSSPKQSAASLSIAPTPGGAFAAASGKF